MKAVRTILFSIIIMLAGSCVERHYVTQSQADTYNDYKAVKYKKRAKTKKKY